MEHQLTECSVKHYYRCSSTLTNVERSIRHGELRFKSLRSNSDADVKAFAFHLRIQEDILSRLLSSQEEEAALHPLYLKAKEEYDEFNMEINAYEQMAEEALLKGKKMTEDVMEMEVRHDGMIKKGERISMDLKALFWRVSARLPDCDQITPGVVLMMKIIIQLAWAVNLCDDSIVFPMLPRNGQKGVGFQLGPDETGASLLTQTAKELMSGSLFRGLFEGFDLVPYDGEEEGMKDALGELLESLPPGGTALSVCTISSLSLSLYCFFTR